MSERALEPATPSSRPLRPSRFALQFGIALAMMALGVLLSFTGLFSDIGMLYVRDQLWLHRIPYIEYPLEYPVGIGIVNWLVALLTPGRQSYVLLTIGLLVAAGVGVVWLARRFAGANLWLLVLAPALATYVALNWDLLAILPTVATLLLLRRNRDGWAGVALALAIWTKFFPVVLVPLVLIDRLARGRWRESLRFGWSLAVISVLVNSPFALRPAPDGTGLRDGWLHFFRFNQARAQEANLWALLASWGAAFDTAQINRASMALMALGLALIGGLLAWSVRRDPNGTLDRLALATLAMLGWWFFFNKVYSPQYSLWLIVLLALLGAPALLAATFALADLLWLGAILLAVAERTWRDWMHAPLLLPPLAFREALILLIIGWALRRMLQPAAAAHSIARHPDPAPAHRGGEPAPLANVAGRT